MNLLSLPVEVIDGHILPFLEWNELLRFRKVCKTLQAIVKGYMMVHPELAPELEINEKDRTFEEFMKLGIPTTKLFLNNTSDLGHGLYEKQWKDVKGFLQEYGPLVKSLRVKQVSLYLYGKELEFLEALGNLEEFAAGHYAFGQEMGKAVFDNLRRANHQPPMTINYPIPGNFKELKALKIGRCDGNLGDLVFIANPLESTSLLEGTKLEYLTPPMGPEFLFHSLPFMTLLLQFMMLRNCLNLEDYQGRLKKIDFVNYHDILPGQYGQRIDHVGSGMSFYHLVHWCAKENIKLKNVAGRWFKNPPSQPDWQEFGLVILSLVNLHPAAFRLNMAHLERIEIRRTSRSYVGSEWRQLGRPEWPELQVLEVHVDSVMPEETIDQDEFADLVTSTKSLLQFLFEGTAHLALTELRLSFEKDDESLPIPKIEDLVASCPNLKKLALVKWPGTNKALVNLWNGLPGLEELSLEYCKNVGNVTFVGEDRDNPVFFKLKNLKKLCLKGLDRMPKITDLLFSLVIRHLNLKHLILTSDGPVESVTPDGIESLLGGRFAETIEKFLFQDWSLAKLTTAEEWKKLEKKFRSEML